MSSTPIITAEGLCYQYGGQAVLDHVGFSVYEGDFVAVIGQNGSGKSTLLRLLLKEQERRAGTISLMDEDIDRFKSWHHIGYVPQNGISLLDGFPATVKEIVAASLYHELSMWRWPDRSHRRREEEALALVGMADYLTRPVSRLSGGQQQRVMIARALVTKPKLLILDEPTAGLDADATAQLYDLLGRLNREGLTLMMVTHDVAGIVGRAGRTFCLEEGTLVELSAHELKHELDSRHKHH